MLIFRIDQSKIHMIRNVLYLCLTSLLLLACIDSPSKKANEHKSNRPVVKKNATEKYKPVNKKEKESTIDPEQLVKATALIENTNPVEVKQVDAAKLFRNYCATCHGLKGDMVVNGSKDLTKTNTSIEERVAQVYFGKGTMTPFKGMLEDAEIIAVAKYLDHLK